MAQVSNTQNTQTPNVSDPSSVQDFAVKNKLVTAWNPKNAAALFEKSGLGTASQYLSAGSNNSSYNMALLAKLKGGYSGKTDPKKISGSGSVSQNQKTGSAMNAALSSVSPAPKAPDGTPPQPAAPSTVPAADPAVQAINDQTNKAKELAQQDFTVQMQPLMDAHAATISALQTQKTQAIAAAKAAYARANPYGAGSDQEEFISSITQGFDSQIQNANTQFTDQTAQIHQQLTDNLAKIDAQHQDAVQTHMQNEATNFKDYLAGLKSSDGTTPSGDEVMDAIKSAMTSGKTFEQATSEIKGALDYAKRVQRKEDVSERHMSNMEAIALGRDARLDRSAAVSNVNTAVDNFTKSGTPGQQLANASSYMSSIEAAAKEGGSGVSALTLIDALVKLDTGGQAIREGQVNLLQKSGTYSDALNRGLAKIQGSNGKLGANTVLTKDQVDQIYTLAKSIAAEKVNAGVQQYKDLKKGVNETKKAYPGTEGIVDATANLGGIDTLINSYSDTYHVDESSGTLYQKIGNNWVAQE